MELTKEYLAAKKRAYRATPEGREKIKAAELKRLAKPECKERKKILRAIRNKTPEARNKKNAYSRRVWATPEGKRKMSAYAKKYYAEKQQTEKYKKQRSDYAKKRNAQEEIKRLRRARAKIRFATDPQFKIIHTLRQRIRDALRRIKIKGKSIALLGCTIDEFKAHIESKFRDEMSWENHGNHGWHIDHIRPCSSFNLASLEAQQICFHYSNMQPLWAHENLKKSWKFTINNQTEI